MKTATESEVNSARDGALIDLVFLEKRRTSIGETPREYTHFQVELETARILSSQGYSHVGFANPVGERANIADKGYARSLGHISCPNGTLDEQEEAGLRTLGFKKVFSRSY